MLEKLRAEIDRCGGVRKPQQVRPSPEHLDDESTTIPTRWYINSGEVGAAVAVRTAFLDHSWKNGAARLGEILRRR